MTSKRAVLVYNYEDRLIGVYESVEKARELCGPEILEDGKEPVSPQYQWHRIRTVPLNKSLPRTFPCRSVR